MSLKLQINSLAALERMIGGDTEIEVEMRKEIMVAFTKKHLGKLAETAAFTEAIEPIKKAAIDAATKAATDTLTSTIGRVDMVRAPHGWGQTAVVTLLESLKLEIQAEAEAHFKAAASGAVDTALAEWTPERVARVIQEREDHHIAQIIKEKVDARMAALRKAIG